MNGKYQLIIYADDVNMLGENLQTVREKTEIFIKASTEIDLEVNSEKSKYMITSRHQNDVQNQKIVTGNLSFENVEKFNWLGVTVTNTNHIHEEIKRRINMGNGCYYLLEKILSSHLLSKKLKINTTIILPVVLYGCETWSLNLREGHRLRVI